jgi:exodeoxyribonuclease VII large subunit
MTKNLTLSELQLLIRDSIYLSLPDFYWVVAEISEIKQNSSGHCYLELIEKRDDETNIKAKVKAVIWSNRYGFIKAFFENATNETLRAGLKVLLKTQIEYHELYGLSLVITDIDPAFTIGEMAAKRLAIIRRLEDEGVFNMNKELELPLVPKRIAIISSSAAAGYRDFINHLKNNSYEYSFNTKLFESTMQGEQNEQDIINALYNIEQISEQFDVVVIIRGGGSQADLGWFDNYNIAFHVTQCPLPIITGIGHDKDMTVTDLVVCRSVKTPTAAADLIIELTAETENYLFEIGDNIKTLALESLEHFKDALELSGKKLMPLTNLILSELRHKMSELRHSFISIIGEQTHKAEIKTEKLKLKLSSIAMTNIKSRHDKVIIIKSLLTSSARKLIKKEENRAIALNNTLEILNPENVIKRGYTITYQNGKVIKSLQNLETGDVIETLFIDGLTKSKITEKNKK